PKAQNPHKTECEGSFALAVQEAVKKSKNRGQTPFQAPQPFENTQLSGAKRAVCPRFFDFFTASKRVGKPMQTILDEAIDQYQRDKFLDEVNAAYARLRADPKAWKEELAERQDWNGTLIDGLEHE